MSYPPSHVIIAAMDQVTTAETAGKRLNEKKYIIPIQELHQHRDTRAEKMWMKEKKMRIDRETHIVFKGITQHETRPP